MKRPGPPELHIEDFENALKELNTYVDVTLDDLMEISQMAQKYAEFRQTEQLYVRDIMSTDVATVTPDTPLRDAARLLLELRISGLPVVDKENMLIGIVTEADFLSAMGVPCHHPAHNLWQTLDAMFRHKASPVNMPEKVADIMTQQIITIHDDDNLHDVIDTMKQNHIKRIVVTNEQQQIQGIITRSNLVKVLLEKML
jgi:CBS domain-containing membrane protein